MRKLTEEGTEKTFWMDEKNNVWVGEPDKVMLNITLNDHLLLEGEARELASKVAQLRKQLGLKPGEPLP